MLQEWSRDDRYPAGVHGEAYRCALLCSVMVRVQLSLVMITSRRGWRGRPLSIEGHEPTGGERGRNR